MFYACFLLLLLTPSQSSCYILSTTGIRIGFNDIWNNIYSGISNGVNHIQDMFTTADKEDDSLNNTISVSLEDAYLNISGLTKKYGYDLEEHIVTTEDGFELTLHRLTRKSSGHNGVVFLMHGIEDSSDSWVLQGPKKALAYVLHEKGYDVWMGNARGNKYSLKHTTLNTTDADFWKFSFEEIGLYDVTAMIDYALNITNEKGLYYIGHSQGTTSFYALMSLRPDFEDKIKLMISLSPVAWMGNARSPVIKLISSSTSILGYFLSNINTYMSTTDLFNKFALSICFLTSKCNNFVYSIIGENTKHMSETMVQVMLGHIPAGSSTMQFIHYGQLARSRRFCRYDSGKEENLKLYGQETPPDYNLNLVSVPIVLFYSDKDLLSDPKDVLKLRNSLPKVYDIVLLEDFNHLDYIFADVAKEKVYDRIIDYIDSFEMKLLINDVNN